MSDNPGFDEESDQEEVLSANKDSAKVPEFSTPDKNKDDIMMGTIDANKGKLHFEQQTKEDSKDPTQDDYVHPAASKVGIVVEKVYGNIGKFFSSHRQQARIGVYILMAILYNGYFLGTIYYWKDSGADVDFCYGAGFLQILTIIAYVGMFYYLYLKPIHGKRLNKIIVRPVGDVINSAWKKRWFRYMVYLILLGILVAFLVLDTAQQPRRLISVLGLFVLILLGFLFSKHPSRVNWTTVIWGLSLQLIFGLITLRWSVGRAVFQCLGDKIATFLAFTDEGSTFVYGYLASGITIAGITLSPIFAFQVLSVVYYFSFIIQILYYYGIMQWIVVKMGFLLQASMGTTACESINAAASIFVGQSESPLLIKPYIQLMTKSELHAIFTGGLATISGSVMAAFISFGISPSHLLTASVMSAPAALSYSKLFYPETEVSHTKAEDISIEKGEETSALDAATRGASTATALVLNIISSIIAFVACIAFLNSILSFTGGLVGAPYLSFEWIISKVFIPLAWLMGVEPKDCKLVANLIGLKTIINEFVAYQKLGEYMNAGLLSEKSEVIATYALCGFSNPSSVGIMIGALSAMAPERRSDVAAVAFRSFIAGSAACFMTACVAGILL